MKKTILLLLGIMAMQSLYAQKTVLAEMDGFEIAYEIQFLGTDEKKNDDKSKDEYQIIGYITNKSGQDMMSRSMSPFHIEVSNATSLTKAAKPNGTRSNFFNLDSSAVYIIQAGATVQDQAKIKVPKGVKPVVNYRKEGEFMPASAMQLMASAAIVNGNWRSADGNAVLSLRMEGNNVVIQQQTPNGTVRWFKANATTYERRFTGLLSPRTGALADPTATYKSTLVFSGVNALTYTNNEGISVIFKKE
jgi:hypothetical protein